ESGSVVPNWSGDAVIQFDEVIDEMAGGGGGGGAGVQGLARQVLLSPVAGDVKVGWHRTSVSIKPKEGWKKRVYRLEIQPGFVDLRRNRTNWAKTVLFTTGPEIGHARIGGITLKWIEQQVLLHALIEAVPLPDTVGYMTMSDSGGQFNLTNLQPGRYIVYAIADENGDRRRGLREAYDSTIVTLDSSSNVAFYTFPHDTVPPRPRGATYVDSITVRVEFSQALDPTASLDTLRVRVVHPLKAETRYVVRITGATNLIGKKGDGDVGFSVPKPVVADTSRRTPRQPPPPPPTSKPPP